MTDSNDRFAALEIDGYSTSAPAQAETVAAPVAAAPTQARDGETVTRPWKCHAQVE